MDNIDEMILSVAVDGADEASDKLSNLLSKQERLTSQANGMYFVNRKSLTDYSQMGREMSQIAREGKKVSGATKRSARNASSLKKELKQGTTQAQLLSRALKFVGSYLAVSKLAGYADEYTGIQNKLALITKDEKERLEVNKELSRIANDTYTSTGATVDLFSKLTTNSKALNLDGEKRLKLTETINKALAVGGGDAESNKGVLLQFGQALGIGKFQGQDLKSIMQNNIGFAQTIADGLGVDVGKLSEMGSKGELTSEKVINALLKQADSVEQKFSKLKPTLGQALTPVRNSFINLLGSLNETTHATEILATACDLLAKGLKFLGDNAKLTATIIGGLLIKRLVDLRRVFLESRAPIGSMRNAMQMLVSGDILSGLKAVKSGLLGLISPNIVNGLKAVGAAGWRMVAPFLKFAVYIYLIRLFLKLCKELFKLFNGEENIFENFWLMYFEKKPDIKAWFSENVTQPLWQFAQEFADTIAYPFEKFWEFVLSLGEKIGEWIADIVIMITEGISNAWDSVKNKVGGWFSWGSDDKEEPKTPKSTPQITPPTASTLSAPTPVTPAPYGQSYSDNKTINITVNEAKDGEQAYTRITTALENNSPQSTYRLAASGLGYAR